LCMEGHSVSGPPPGTKEPNVAEFCFLLPTLI
jgi:hypothetical protein